MTKKCDYEPAEWYVYKDKSVTTLPANLPMPPTNTFYLMFRKCEELEDITALANWDVSNVKNMRSMFSSCYQLRDITPLANWDVSSVEDMCGMFSCCSRLKDITPLANWNVSNVKNMSYMFHEIVQLQDFTALANWDVSKVEDMRWMFYCDQLEDVYTVEDIYGEDDTNSIKAYLRDLPKPNTLIIDLPSDWQNIELPQWNP